jgi:choline dehydrogenase
MYSHSVRFSESFNMTAARSLLVALLLSRASCVPISEHGKRQDAGFDYVIVGGGTAGLTLAARLSEDSSTSVAVVEAGTYYSITDPLVASTPAGDTVSLPQLGREES